MDKAQRVKALIDSGRFQETDRPWLEQVPEDRLSALEAQPAATNAQPPQNTTVETQTVTPPADNTQRQETITNPPVVANKKQTAEEFIASAPPELQESLREGLRVQQSRRKDVVTALKATGRCEFSDEQLAAKPICELERLLKLADVPAPANFTGRVNVGHTVESKGVPPPPSLEVAVKAARGIK